MQHRSFFSSIPGAPMLLTTLPIAGLLISLAVSLLFPLEYSSSARLLVFQDDGPADAYVATRSEELIADKLTSLLYTTTFFDLVTASSTQIRRDQFPTDERKARKAWEKAVTASVARGRGLIHLTAYHTDPAQAEEMVRAVSDVFVDRAKEFTASPSVRVLLVDEPLNSRYPERPNVIGNGLAGAVAGALIALVILWGRAAKKQKGVK